MFHNNGQTSYNSHGYHFSQKQEPFYHRPSYLDGGGRYYNHCDGGSSKSMSSKTLSSYSSYSMKMSEMTRKVGPVFCCYKHGCYLRSRRKKIRQVI
jgi:hypothetical protein